jgi:hypothetical protein
MNNNRGGIFDRLQPCQAFFDGKEFKHPDSMASDEFLKAQR